MPGSGQELLVGSKWGAGLENRWLERAGNPDEGSVQVIWHRTGLLAPTTADTDNNYYLLFETQHVLSSYKIQNNGPWPRASLCNSFYLLWCPGLSPPGGASGVPVTDSHSGLDQRLRGPWDIAHPTSHRTCTTFPTIPHPHFHCFEPVIIFSTLSYLGNKQEELEVWNISSNDTD